MAEPVAFSDLVKEAFIDPIRSVLIVDDQYPTWEETLNDRRSDDKQDQGLQARSMGKKWRSDPDAPASVIQQFRSQKPGLVIDIHDANSPVLPTDGDQSAKLPPDYLHQSDLLILDYNLEGSSTGLEGKLARSCLQAILRNQHFNLVVVHTEETDLQAVFYDCILSLLTAGSLHFDEKDKQLISDVEGKMDDWVDEEKFNPSDLAQRLDTASYLELRHPSGNLDQSIGNYMNPNGKQLGPLSSLAEWANELELTGSDRRGFALWALREFEKLKDDLLAASSFSGLNWSSANGHFWLRTSRGFVTFVEKKETDLISKLQEALVSWQPTPSRLLSAKLRHELASNGVVAEDRALSRKHVFAHFYRQLSKFGSVRERSVFLRDQIRRQMEALSFQIEEPISEFGLQLCKVDASDGTDLQSHYGVDFSGKGEEAKAVSHFNSYVSTLPIRSGTDQLDCGHIFRIENDWWVCATPACDLQPGQNSIAFVGQSQSLRPFTALKLEPISEELSSHQINSGDYCFVESSEGEIQCFGARTANGLNADKATWRTFLAKEDGRFSDNQLALLVPKLSNDSLENNECEAVIMGKLRYEYALHYVQKVGSSVTRIGLGYANKIHQDKPSK